MRAQDKARIIKLDEELIELEAKIEATMAREQAEGMKYFLPSRALKHKWAAKMETRDRIAKRSYEKVEQHQSYTMLLNARSLEVAQAEDDVRATAGSIASLIAAQGISPSADFHVQMAELRRSYKTLAVVLSNKKRALDNWIAKSELSVKVERKSFGKKLQAQVIKRDDHLAQEWDLRVTAPDAGIENLKIGAVSYQDTKPAIEYDPRFNTPPLVGQDMKSLLAIIDSASNGTRKEQSKQEAKEQECGLE